MDTKKLRQKILDLAIRGKLVPQDPNDEPASVLLERIRAEKEHLIKDGKIRRNKKTTSDTTQKETPFEIPESWEWTTLGEISNYGITTNVDVKDVPQNAWVLELEDLEKDSASIIKWITKDEREIKGVRHSFKKGDVLYSKLRTYLNKVLVAPEDGYCTTEIIPISFPHGVHSTYLNHVLRSKFFLDYTIQCGYGVKMPRLSTNDASKGQVPLPPLNEQKRIVSAIEQWFSLIDILENEKSDLQASIQQAKFKILDLAIHGKLVPQDPNDEPAIELLKRLNPKFEGCEHLNNNVIHSGWCVAKLEDVIELLDNKRIPIKSEDREQRIKNKGIAYPYYGATGLVGYIDDYLLDGRYILLGEDGAPFEDKYANVAYVVNGKIWVNNHAHVLSPKISFEYLLYSLNAVDYTLYAKGTTRLKLTQKDMLSIPISVPPYQEQLRIVAKIEELFSVLDSIKESLA